MDNAIKEIYAGNVMDESFLRDRAETLQILYEMEVATELQIAREEIERIGIEKGEKIGIEKGEKIGIEKGEKIGIEKGEKIGIEKGVAIATKKNAISLYKNGASPELISNSLNIPIDELKTILELE